jgi:hypothetical protein
MPDTHSAQFSWVPQRAATIEIEQAADGYWNATVRITAPTLPRAHVQTAGSFHNAGEALDWARLTIENVVSYA